MKLNQVELLLLLLLLNRGRRSAASGGGAGGAWPPAPDGYNIPVVPLPPNPLEKR